MKKALLALTLVFAAHWALAQVDEDKPTIRVNAFAFEKQVTIFLDGNLLCTITSNMCVVNTTEGHHKVVLKIEGRADQTSDVLVHKQHNSNPAFKGTKDEWEVVGICMVSQEGNLDCSDEQ